MKTRIMNILNSVFFSPKPLLQGISQSILEIEGVSHRLHLRTDAQGEGVLVLDASTVLHLNRTATEIAYHLIKKTEPNEIVRILVSRYQVSSTTAREDIENLTSRLESLIRTPDLDPETFLDIAQVARHFRSSLEIPNRLDCALTYQVMEGNSELFAPIDRVHTNLSTEDWKTILSKAWESGIPHVVFTGGEPTLRPDLIELIQYSESLGQVTGLITDGHRLGDNKYLDSLLVSGLDHLMLILQPGLEESWEAVRDAVNADIALTVHLTINSKIEKETSVILARLITIGVTSISLSAESTHFSDVLEATRQQAAELSLKLVFELPVPYSAINPFTIEMEKYESSKSGAGTSWLYIEPDGDVLPGQGINTPLGNFLIDPWITISGNRKLTFNK